jgi:homoserine kinase type II
LVPVEAGTVNTSSVARLRSGESLFLRLYEQQGLTGAEAEALLLGELSRRGVPTPAPLGRSGSPDMCVAIAKGKPLVAFPFIRGVTLRQSEVTTRHAAQVGEALARLHLASAGLALPADRFSVAALIGLTRRFGEVGDDEARALAPWLEQELGLADRARDARLPHGLIHADLFRDNVLFDGDRLAALLDFESCHGGAFVYDIAVVLQSWCYGSSLDLDLGRAVLSGYESVRRLDEAEWRGLYAESRFACLRFLTTRIADKTARLGKHPRRFQDRLRALDELGAAGIIERVRR